MPQDNPGLLKRINRRVVRWLTQLGAGLVRRLPIRSVQRLGDFVGWLIFVCIPSRQRMADDNIALAMGDRLTAYERKRVRYFSTRNTVKTMLELFKLPAMSDADFDALVSFENPEVLEAAAAQGKGVIVTTAHFGNWEMLAAGIARLGYELAVVARDSSDRETASVINESRESAGERVIERSEVREMFRVAKSGGLLGILPDQYAKKGGVLGDFLGRRTRTFTGPATFAQRTGTVVLPAFGRRTGDDHIVCYFLPPLEMPDTGDREADVIAGTQLINDVLGAEIMRHPAQWLWLHNRWRKEDEDASA